MGHTPFSSFVAGFSHSALFTIHPSLQSLFFAIFFVYTKSIEWLSVPSGAVSFVTSFDSCLSELSDPLVNEAYTCCDYPCLR